MSAFSFTAPYFTEEDEQNERDTLTDDERIALERDIFGSDRVLIEETPEMLERGLQLAREALEHCIATNPKDASAYVEALERVPELVKRESDLTAFLRCENYDAWAAAQHLLEYWSTRKLIFGPIKAFLPMTLTGALSEDVEVLRKGLLHTLPDPDESGRKILFWDRIRSVRSVASRDAVLRCTFYNLQALAESIATQKSGLVWMVNFKGYDLYLHFDRILSRKMVKAVYAHPIKLRAVHMLQGSGQSVLKMALPVLKHMWGKYFRLRMVMHSGVEKEILARLQQYGIPPSDHVIAVLAGSGSRYCIDYVLQWVAERQALEEQRAEAYAQ